MRQRGRSLTILVMALSLVAAFILTRPLGREVAAGSDDRIPAFATATFPLATEVTLAARAQESKRRTVTLQGSGTVLFHRYVLTVAHAIAWDNFRAGLRASGAPQTDRYQSVKMLMETTYLMLPDGRLRLTPLARSDEADVALFSLPDDTSVPDLPCAIGDSDALRLGEPVLLVERDPSAGPLLRPAAVAALRGTAQTAAVIGVEQTFVLSIGLVAGESGSPLLTSNDRSCALVGLAQGTFRGPRQLSWGIRIREAIEALAISSEPAPPSGFLEDVCRAAIRPGAFSFCVDA